jgi:hypothetical protein
MPFGLTEWEAQEVSKEWVEQQEQKKRFEQLRIQALGAAISRKDWWAVGQAYEAIRDAFDRPDIYSSKLPLSPADREGK